MGALLVGCYAAAPPRVDPSYEAQLAATQNATSSDCASRSIRDVTVRLGPGIDDHREGVFIAHHGPEYVRRGVLAELRKRSLTEADSRNTMTIGVDRVRIRSSLTTFFVGLVSGPDFLTVTVFTSCGETRRDLFQASVSSMKPGIVMTSSQGRFNGVVRKLSEQIAERYQESAAVYRRVPGGVR